MVGLASSLNVALFLCANGATCSLQSLLPAGAGRDLGNNTNFSAKAVANDRTGVYCGRTDAYPMVRESSAPEPCTGASMLADMGLELATTRWRRPVAVV